MMRPLDIEIRRFIHPPNRHPCARDWRVLSCKIMSRGLPADLLIDDVDSLKLTTGEARGEAGYSIAAGQIDGAYA